MTVNFSMITIAAETAFPFVGFGITTLCIKWERYCSEICCQSPSKLSTNPTIHPKHKIMVCIFPTFTSSVIGHHQLWNLLMFPIKYALPSSWMYRFHTHQWHLWGGAHTDTTQNTRGLFHMVYLKQITVFTLHSASGFAFLLPISFV